MQIQLLGFLSHNNAGVLFQDHLRSHLMIKMSTRTNRDVERIIWQRLDENDPYGSDRNHTTPQTERIDWHQV